MVFKRPAPQGRKLFSVPQTIGQSGWIFLSYPHCYWITTKDTKKIPCCVDQRLCGDTLLRCEKIRGDFIVSDIFIYNSNRVFHCSTFEQRYNWLKDLLKFFKHIPGYPRFIHKSALEKHHGIRGQESYTDDIGSTGYYSEDIGQIVKIKKHTLPDCYMVEESYLRVPDLKTSKYLRTLGDEFELKCTRNEDGSWVLV